MINGKPLIYWSIKNCLNSGKISSTWVSSDNKKILKLATKFGAKIIIRPKYLASDKASSDNAWLHAVKYIEKLDKIDIIVGVQPTSPIRSKFDFDKAIGKFIKGKFNSMFSASNFETFFTWQLIKNKVKSNYNLNKRPRRQEIKKTILENGSFYIFKQKKFLKNQNRLFGKIGFYLMEKYKGFQLDTLEDVKIINSIFKNYIK